jgi:phage terminase large subunit-like protein
MIDEDRLDELEQNLADAKYELEVARFNERYSSLEFALMQQERWVGNGGTLFAELQLLKADVENVRVINETIPRTCFKKIEIEPTS